jgi:NADPH-dependent 2,4-dienoyl-CoA reductase/sulfur reductase-like enzyme
LIDEAPRPGGQIWRHVSRHSLPRSATTWLHRLDKSGAQVLSGTTVIDVVRNGDSFTIVTTAGAIDATEVIIATGARERFIPFPGWTLPGVTGVGGGQALLKAGASMRDRRIIVAGSGPLLLPVAAALSKAGAKVTHVLEQASTARVASFALSLVRTPSRIMQAASYRAQSFGARYMTDTWVASAEGSSTVRSAAITNGRRTWTEPCDMLCVGYGLVPSTEIARLAGCTVQHGAVVIDAYGRTNVNGIFAAGEQAGVAGVDAAIAEGQIAAMTACGAKAAAHIIRSAARERAFAQRMDVAFKLRPELLQLATPQTIVCRCEDVTLGAIARCESMREAKLHTRAGMGPCQGRVCGPALELMFNWTESSVRPPLAAAHVSAFLSSKTSGEPS